MKPKKPKLIIGSLSLSLLVIIIIFQPIIQFKTEYFKTPEQAVLHNKVSQALLINTDYEFAFYIGDDDSLNVKDIDSWSLFGEKRYGCHDGFTSSNYVCNQNDIGICTILNYQNTNTYFYHSYVVPSVSNMVIGGLTRLPKPETLVIDGKKPTITNIEIKGERYSVWFIKNQRLRGTIIEYDGKPLCTI